jgi:hypothetical protein
MWIGGMLGKLSSKCHATFGKIFRLGPLRDRVRFGTSTLVSVCSLVRLSILVYVAEAYQIMLVLRFLGMGNNIGGIEPENTKVEN